MTSDWTITWEHKGFPPRAHGCAASELKDLGLTVPGDVSTPLAVLHEGALQHNLTAMANWCRDRDVALAPHVKTTMSPELMRRQLDGGAWGTTAATAWQARAQIEMGSPRVLIANESLDAPALTGLLTLLRDLPTLEVLVFADSIAAVDSLARIVGTVDGAGPLPVVIDVGHPNGRAGIRDHEAAVRLAEHVAAGEQLLLAGVGGYEGVVGGDRTDATLAAVRSYLRRVRAVALETAERGLVQRPDGGIVTAGGSLFYDLVADELAGLPGMRTVIRPGCYLVHDHGVYARNTDDADPTRPHLLPAMEVWARVLSTPEPGLALADAGRRDISDDAGPPVVLAVVRDGARHDVHPDVAVTGFNDQHTFLRLPREPGHAAGLVPQVGDALVLGISHPCTTIDKWRAIAVVDGGVVTGAIRTRF